MNFVYNLGVVCKLHMLYQLIAACVIYKWYKRIRFRANPDKFQTIAVGKRIFGKNLVFKNL